MLEQWGQTNLVNSAVHPIGQTKVSHEMVYFILTPLLVTATVLAGDYRLTVT
jgi:hypothetical protein